MRGAAGQAARALLSCCVGYRRAGDPRLSVTTGPLVVALDFHGVIIDSEPVMSRVAWRTGCRLWPHLTDGCAVTEGVMDESAYVDRRRLGGQPLCGTAEDAMPIWLRAKMRLLSPMMQSDDDALLLVRLCMEEALGDDPRKRPLTVGEVTSNWGGDLKETLLLRYGMSASGAMAACAETRDAWMSGEPSEWEEAHLQFPATLADVRDATMPSLMSRPIVYIFARSDADVPDVRQLLDRHCVRMPAERVLSAADAKGKSEALAALRLRHPEATIRYVDDSADSLRAIAADPRLFSVGAFFASWGYSTAEQESRVAAMPRVRALSSSRELDSVLQMPRKDGTRVRF